MLQAARIDAIAAARFMRILEQRSADLPRFASYLSSHPLSAGRAQELERMAGQTEYAAIPLMDAQRWSRVRAGCGR
jgi:hypothetical protein